MDSNVGLACENGTPGGLESFLAIGARDDIDRCFDVWPVSGDVGGHRVRLGAP
jgi:hypothetical protein